MNNNLNQNNGMQKRMLIMTLVVFVFFIAYEFLVLKPQQEAKAAQAKTEQTQKATPDVVEGMVQTDPTGNPVDMSKSVQALSSKAIASSEILTVIKTKRNIIEIDTLGRVAQVTLLEEKYKDEQGNQIKLFEANQLRPLEVRFADTNINKKAFEIASSTTSSSVDATQNKQTLVLTQNLGETVLTKTFTIYPNGHYDLEVNSTNDKKFFITNGFRPNVLADMYADHGLYLKLNDGTMELTEDGDLDNTKNYVGIKFVSNFDRYYATVVYNFEKSLALSLMPDNEGNPQAFIHGGNGIAFSGYMGPKNFKDLEALNPQLTDVIEYGWFTFIAKPMFLLLQFIQGYVGNWGWTIVILTILVKLVLYPLSYKGMVSMNKLKELAPKMKEIQTKYKDDKQKQSMHMMELYKKHGANPMGGCLPLILQIPVFFAIYRVLLNAIELKGAEWILWVQDLAEMDPYFVLPVLMGVTMFIQQKITPNTMQDEMQKKIFQMLPIIFTFFFLWFPAGLTLYWFVNNLFTIAQQYYINKIFEKQRVLKK
ncbi:membrane protein insertase YidC [Malaciobacter pacificus]|jgi:YidC/Oxa1 family membrane protein insertase|uniref:Membrane protein insertase YidC n=1 Tax=Malaciobacter pacificus TaxID=1080223 RepID=A0A5C2H9V3_9BACT|nr:membrane protein insertase YidC [Malaciobacter pacificus]QEP34988.1 membrane protein insertase, YidC/Oxa1 family [Malaciobacter pacificus]GGD42487.1 membrane protein insertase YidC [Malaciobacter pacificus]